MNGRAVMARPAPSCHLIHSMCAKWVYNRCHFPRFPKRRLQEKVKKGQKKSQPEKRGQTRMDWKRLIFGILTALAMMAATYVLPRGGALRDAALAQFPMTVGVWAIFVLLFVKLK
jgi:hypothetical protein